METKFTPVHYASPIKGDMAIMIAFCNPQKSIRIVQNILSVVHSLRTANIPYFIHELAFNGEPHLFAPAENVKLSRSTSYMFYKENLIHTLLPQIPEMFTKICIIDADIFFDNKYWYTIVSSALDIYDVCQPFMNTYLLGPDYKPLKKVTNCVDSSNSNIDHAWAFRRSWYEESGLPDVTIVGGGNFVMSTVLRGSHDKTYLLYKDFLPTKSFADTRHGSCDIDIYQYYHGSNINHQYHSHIESTTEMLSANNITFQDIFYRRKDGILEWKPAHRTVMNDLMRSRHNDDLVKEDFIAPNKFFTPAPYIYPAQQDMVVVIPFFNPVQYNRSAQNIITIVHLLDQARIPYYIGEMAYGTNPFLFKAASNIIQFRSTSNMFYKENLVDVIEPQLPAVYNKICMLDADIFFGKPDWYTQTSRLLDTCDICQPFTAAIWMHPDYTEYRRRTHCLGSSLPVIDWLREHPGFVWAFRRDWYKTFTYRHIPICTTGGDTILHDLVKGRQMSVYKYYKKYYNTVGQSVRYDWLEGDIYHLNHGSYDKRMYPNYVEDVRKLLDGFGYPMPSDAVYHRDDGILEWKDNCRQAINEFNTAYFLSREEDEV
jgi:hypothetical protein